VGAGSQPDPRLDDVVELLNGLGTLLMEIDSKLERIAHAGGRVNDRTPEDREEFRKLIERGRVARKQMQETIDRVRARQLERQKPSTK